MLARRRSRRSWGGLRHKLYMGGFRGDDVPKVLNCDGCDGNRFFEPKNGKLRKVSLPAGEAADRPVRANADSPPRYAYVADLDQEPGTRGPLEF